MSTRAGQPAGPPQREINVNRVALRVFTALVVAAMAFAAVAGSLLFAPVEPAPVKSRPHVERCEQPASAPDCGTASIRPTPGSRWDIDS